jgi:hypothetical protein
MRTQERRRRHNTTARNRVQIYRQAPVYQSLTLDYFHSIGEKLEDEMETILEQFNAELEHLGVLPATAEGRAELDEENLREIASRVENAQYEVMAVRENRYSTQKNIDEAQEELDEVTAEYNSLRDQQKLQDAIYDDPTVSIEGRGNTMFINVSIFNPVALGLSIGAHPYDFRFTGRLTHRLKDDEEEEGELKIRVGPGFRDGGLQRIFPTIGSAQLRILDDNLYGIVLAALRRAENAAYAEATDSSRRRFVPARGPPPLLRTRAIGAFNNASPFRAASLPGNGGLARTLSYHSNATSRTLSAPGSVVMSPGPAAAAAAEAQRGPVRSIFAAMGMPEFNNSGEEEEESKLAEDEE